MAKNNDGLVGSLRTSPVTQRLTDEARRLLDSQADRLAGKVENGVSALTKVGESGQLPALGKGASKLLKTGKPGNAAMTAAKEAVTDKAKNLFGGGKGKGTGQAKAVNIEESIDVGVPVRVAYDQWTQFKDFSRFMKGVESVEQTSDTETNWKGKVFKSRRTWKATITDQVPDERISWTSEGSKGSTKGVVTFHPLGENLTRVMVAMEYFPVGMFEKTGNIWRAVGRRTRLDLKNYRRFVTMEGEPTGSWRGKIEDSKVVSSGESEQRKSGSRRREGASSSRSGPSARSGRGAGSRPSGRAGSQRSRSSERSSSGSDRSSSTGRSSSGRSSSTGRSSSGQSGSSSGRTPRKATAASASTPRKRTAKASAAGDSAPRKRTATKRAPSSSSPSSSSSSSSSRARKAQPAKKATASRRRSSS